MALSDNFCMEFLEFCSGYCTQVFYYFAPAFSLVVKLYDFGLIKNSNRFIRGSNPRFDYDFVLFYVHKARLPKQRTALQSAPWLLILFLLIIFLFSLFYYTGTQTLFHKNYDHFWLFLTTFGLYYKRGLSVFIFGLILVLACRFDFGSPCTPPDLTFWFAPSSLLWWFSCMTHTFMCLA